MSGRKREKGNRSEREKTKRREREQRRERKKKRMGYNRTVERSEHMRGEWNIGGENRTEQKITEHIGEKRRTERMEGERVPCFVLWLL